MFDYITCKYPLPEVDLTGTSLTLKEITLDNQTKDLENSLEHYTIEEDGRISYTHYNVSRWIKPDERIEGIFAKIGSIERDDPETRYLTGNHVIVFGNFIHKDEDSFDYSWDFEAKIDEGKVTSIRLMHLKKFPNEERKKTSAELREKMRRYEKYKKTFRYKYFFKYLYKLKTFLKIKMIQFLGCVIKFLYKI